MYHPAFADHLENPRNVGELAEASVTVEQQNPACGDRLRLSLKIEDEIITIARIKVYGCPQTLAAASALSELITQRSIREAAQLDRQTIADALGGLPRHKLHAAALALDALLTALAEFARQQQARTGHLKI